MSDTALLRTLRKLPIVADRPCKVCGTRYDKRTTTPKQFADSGVRELWIKRGHEALSFCACIRCLVSLANRYGEMSLEVLKIEIGRKELNA